MLVSPKSSGSIKNSATDKILALLLISMSPPVASCKPEQAGHRSTLVALSFLKFKGKACGASRQQLTHHDLTGIFHDRDGTRRSLLGNQAQLVDSNTPTNQTPRRTLKKKNLRAPA